MGADAFLAFYGIKIPIDSDDFEEFAETADESDPRCIAAKRVGLETLFDRMTDGEDCFLLIGQNVAWLGLEHATHVSQTIESLASIAANVNSKLLAAGFTETPKLHLQFVGQY